MNYMDPIIKKHASGLVPLLGVRYAKELSNAAALDEVSLLLDKEERVPLSYAPWASFPYKPDTRFSIISSADCLFLKFYVEEKTVVAAHYATHAPVYKDSCVEFFISLDDSGYYNFEFNSTGTCLAAFGKKKEGRAFLPMEAVDRIRRRAVIDREPTRNGVRWTLTLILPFNSFVYHRPLSLRGRECRANVYKCGDEAPDPHFLCWAPVDTPEPDFHQSRYFGLLNFE